MNNDQQYTALSQKEFDALMKLDMSPGEAVDYFYHTLNIRKFNEVLALFAQNKIPEGKNLVSFLTDKLCEYTPDSIRDSVRRKISNWVNGISEPENREDWIKICFALELDDESAQKFMKHSTEGGFHLRNPREITFLYCLRKNARRDYPEACALIESVNADGVKAPERDESQEAFTFTQLVSDSFNAVHDDNSFKKFCLENLENFGHLHNTAYNYFKQYFSLLTSPDTLYSEADKKISIEQAVDDYLRMKIPMDRSTKRYNALQKVIKNFWPDATAITRILNRTNDVTRKLMLLLYVVTEGVSSTDENDLYMEDLTAEEALVENVTFLNLRLNSWGMSALDPRNPFDWLILYSLRVDEEDADDNNAFMSSRLENVLNILFNE